MTITLQTPSGLSVNTATEADIWPDGCPYPPSVRDEIIHVARNEISADDLRDVKVAHWYAPYFVAEQRVQERLKRTASAESQVIKQLRAEVDNLSIRLAQVDKIIVPGGELTKLLIDVVGKAMGQSRAEVTKEAETKLADVTAENAALRKELDQLRNLVRERAITHMVVNREGNLVAATDDGKAWDLGPVVGQDGASGAPGKDGLGFDDLEMDYDGERRVTFKFVQGERVKEFPTIVIPCQIYREVWKEGQFYERGDTVTWGGAVWHALACTNEKPIPGNKTWRLAVKSGRDGRDGAKGDKGEKGEKGDSGRPGRDLTDLRK
jgi:hypothetical protein